MKLLVEIRAFKEHKELSDDSLAFSASLWLEGANGKLSKAGIITNEGQGGPHRISPAGKTDKDFANNRQRINEFEKWCRTLPDKTLTPSWTGGEPFTVKMDSDVYINELLEPIIDALDKKDEDKYWRNLCKKGTVIRLVDFAEGESTMVRLKSGATPRYTPQLAIQVRKVYGDKLVEIVNERFNLQGVLRHPIQEANRE